MRFSHTLGCMHITEVLKTYAEIQFDITNLCSELTFERAKKLVLMVVITSDDMILKTMNFPEVFFMDCTAHINQ